MRNPICLLRALWRSVRTLEPVSGHEFRTSDEPTPENIHILTCRTCGAESVSWGWDSLEGQK